MIIKDFLHKFNKYVPDNLALSFDNVGLLVGHECKNISGIYVCLDVNDEVIDYVIKIGINTIISHHPIIFNSIKSVTDRDLIGRRLLKCIENKINVISYHTNLDAIACGMNDKLVDILGFGDIEVEILNISDINEEYGIGRILYLREDMEVLDIIHRLKNSLNIDLVRFADCGKSKVRKICVINGSGNSMIKNCFGKVDLVITGDTTYHNVFDAVNNNISIIDIGHFNSENFIYMEVMKGFFQKLNMKDISIYYDSLLTDVYKFI